VLRFTREGAAAGNEHSGSPVLAMGNAHPVSLAWEAGAGLLLASGDRREPRLAVVPLASYSDSRIWPASAVPVGSADDLSLQAGLRAVAAAPMGKGQPRDTIVALVGTDPEALYFATLIAGAHFELTLPYRVPLGPFAPTTVTFDDVGDVFVAGRLGPDDSRVGVLRLRAR
jgi:hypothetical protein